MICVHCGTLNPNGAERCAHCGRPPLAGAVEMCATHPDREAVATCGICDKPLCDHCVVRVAGSAYCPEHAVSLAAPPTETGSAYARPVVNISAARPSTFGERVGAGVLDLALIIIYLLILYLVLWALSGSPPTQTDAGGWRAVFWLLAVLAPLAYLCWENADNGQTLGKTGTDLIALKEDGTLMDARTGALRGLLSALFFALGGIGFWYMLWSPDHRALHDHILKTVVVKSSSE